MNILEKLLPNPITIAKYIYDDNICYGTLQLFSIIKKIANGEIYITRFSNREMTIYDSLINVDITVRILREHIDITVDDIEHNQLPNMYVSTIKSILSQLKVHTIIGIFSDDMGQEWYDRVTGNYHCNLDILICNTKLLDNFINNNRKYSVMLLNKLIRTHTTNVTLFKELVHDENVYTILFNGGNYLTFIGDTVNNMRGITMSYNSNTGIKTFPVNNFNNLVSHLCNRINNMVVIGVKRKCLVQ